jgi:hypothetical protein
VVAGLLACPLPSSALAGDLDQQQPDGSGGLVAIISNQSLAQSFTAGRSGLLDQVDLDLQKNNSPTVLSVELRNVAAGVPGTQVLAAASVSASSVPTTLGFVAVGFPVPAPVTAGTQYSIVAYTASASPNFYQWGEQGPNPYPSGAAFGNSSSPPTTGWIANGWDQAFKTYVAPPTVAAPAAPSNAFTIGRVKGKSVLLSAPGAGKFTITDRSKRDSVCTCFNAASGASGGGARAAAKALLKHSSATASGPGTVTVPLVLTKPAKTKLRQRGKLTVNAAIVFAPTGGTAHGQTAALKLKKK